MRFNTAASKTGSKAGSCTWFNST